MQCVVLVIKLIMAHAGISRGTCKCVVLLIKVVFILCRRAFAWARKPYRIVLPFIHKNGDFRAISITEGSCAALRWSQKWRVTYRRGVYTIPGGYSGRDENLSGRAWIYPNEYEYEIKPKVFVRVLKEKRHPRKLFFFPPKRLVRLFILRDVKPSPDSKTATLFPPKPVVEWRRLSRFPAKMTLVRARALLSIEKISYS